MGKMDSDRYIYQWELDGKRRPLPPLWKAVENYGAENVYHPKPSYVPDGRCPWCGEEVTNKRRTYCNDECRKRFDALTVWGRGRGAYSVRILYRDNFTCQECGEYHAYKNEHGIYLPVDDGELDVHHKMPVARGGGDEPDNLTTLCKRCHNAAHTRKAPNERG